MIYVKVLDHRFAFVPLVITLVYTSLPCFDLFFQKCWSFNRYKQINTIKYY